MAVRSVWHVENHVIQVIVSGNITSDEMLSAMEDAAQLIEQSAEVLVHTLVDVVNMDSAPMRVKERFNAVQPVLSHPRCGWVLIYGNKNPIANMISGTVAQMFRARFRTFNTRDEAVAFLKDMVPNLAEMPAIS